MKKGRGSLREVSLMREKGEEGVKKRGNEKKRKEKRRERRERRKEVRRKKKMKYKRVRKKYFIFQFTWL
jgi:hypothetical protein